MAKRDPIIGATKDRWKIEAPSVSHIGNARSWQARAELLTRFGLLDLADPLKLQLPEGLQLVFPCSPLPLRRAVEKIAYQFQRQFGYDFLQYVASEKPDKRDGVWAWTTSNNGHGHHYLAIGAAVFRWREWDNAPNGYGLAWVWIHPFAQRCGLLAQAWPFFRMVYGDFCTEPPLSKSMKEFLAKRGECWRCGVSCSCDQTSK